MGRRPALVVFAAAALLVGGSSAAAAPIAFTTSYSFTFPFTDHSVRGLTVGDLNGDGRPDIVAGEFGGKIFVFLNDGNGGYLAPQSYDGQCGNASAFGGLSGVAIGHFTSSGHMDILVGCDWYTDGFVVYAGNGDGTFQAPRRIQPIQMYLGENTSRQPVFGGIGLTNLVHGDFAGTQAVVWNEWEAGAGAPVLCMMPDSEIAADTGTDPVPNSPHCAVVIINDENPPVDEMEFGRPVTLGTLPFPSPGSPFAFGPTPADEHLNSGSMRAAFFDPAHPGFSWNDIEPNDAVAGFPSLLATPDLTGDGSSELVAEAGTNGDQVAVYSLTSFVDNSGVLVIPDPQLFSTNPALGEMYGAVAGDFDGDGHPDVAVLGEGASLTYVEILPGDGAGGLGAPQSFQVADFASDSYLATGDFNGDGRPDLLTVVGDELSVLIDTPPRTLTVSKTGTGSGTVTSSPAGISCGSTCSHGFDDGTAVTLTAAPAAGSTFTGWSGGGCSGTGSCHVTPHADTTVTAAFALPVPTITTFTPSSGPLHATVTVTGTNLLGATSVKLHGVSAPFSVVSATSITLTVPSSATSGTISVTTPGGTATSSGSFTVADPPTITSISPGSGPVGTLVTVTGTNLDRTVGIEIGGLITVPLAATATQVTFSVPPGAVTGPVKVLALNGSATSVGTFTVTP